MLQPLRVIQVQVAHLQQDRCRSVANPCKPMNESANERVFGHQPLQPLRVIQVQVAHLQPSK
jgi:hypothetical protein